MTCNPEWDEIKREVTPIGLKAEDRPDILCRVFKIKLDGLIDDLKEEKIFGKILGYVCAVEFQKRGLPHTHILLFMSNEFKPQIPDDIDKHITTEIPDKNERPNLYGAVQNYMVHGPCGPYNKNSPCMKNRSCSKFYPKEFRQRTLIDEAEFSKYRRTDNGRTVKKRECEIQEKELFVIRLPFHLEDEQPVVYGETSNVNDIVERAISHKSMFLEWMAANMSYPYARSLTYAEFPTKFVWKDDSSKWFPRKKGFAIGRLTHVLAELTMSDDEIKQLCLMDIDKILHSYGKTLKDYPPMPLATEVDSSLLTKRLCIVTGGFFFVYGHGSTGKIFLWNLMSAEIRSRGDIVLNVASSGIASLLLPNGRTAHSRFKIPLNITEDSVCNIKPGSSQAILLLKAKFIIWDEAPMVSRYYYEALDKCLGDIIRKHVLKGFFKARTILAPTLDIVEEVNNHLMAIILGGKKLYLSSDSISMDEGNMESQLDLYGPELLNSINCSGLLPHKLILKVGVPMMLLRNIDQSSGLCNGTRLQVRKLGNHVIECEVLMGNNVGHIALIPRMNIVPTNETVPVRFQRRQFP
ncbi:uncharacterized protein [Arachis hypogaea]|uniref:uncharacterized protein n=1 Tax=Arachis hypogaea TaxID=3818 RepID=UPI000DEDEB32